MGKFGSPQIGVFSPEGNNYDDPNLNKCVNCGALFQGGVCPICKTACVPEMMAGNRKKKSKPAKKKSKLWIILVVILAVVGILVFVLNKLTDKISDNSPNDMLAVVTNAPKFDKDSYNSGIGYEELYRYPDKYKGEKVKITGLVYVAVDGEPNSAIITDQSGLFNWFCVTYTSKESEARLMSGNIVTVYGKGNGLFDYDWMTVPWVSADLIELDPISTGKDEDIHQEETARETTKKPEPETIEFEFGETIEIGNWQVTVTDYAITHVGQAGTVFSDRDSISVYITIKNIGSEKRSLYNDMSFSLVYDGKYTYTPDDSFGINDAVPVMGNDNGYYYFYIPKEICESDMQVEAVITAKNTGENLTIYRAKYPAK